MSKSVATNIHRLIADLWHDPAVEQEFNRDRSAVYQRYQLSDKEIEAMDNPELETMGRLGVFPICQVIYLLKADPKVREHISMAKYVERIRSEVTE